MKTKILIGILIVLVIVLGVLFGLKVYLSNNEEKETTEIIDAEENSVLTVVLNNKDEDNKEEETSIYSGSERTIAVVIDNVGDAIPQTSLNEAMIVYEMYVEGGLTRFLAIYKNTSIDTIGPVRSARPCFIDYALEHDSILVHYGGSPKALTEIENLGMETVNRDFNTIWCILENI